MAAVHLPRRLAVAALIAANLVLVGLNLDKHGLFPFDEGSSGRAERPASSTSTSTDSPVDGGPVAPEDTDDGGEVDGDGSTTVDDAALEPDDWPGGRGPIPDGPPTARAASLVGDGTIRLTGSVPSWAAATELADRAGGRLPRGLEAVTIDYSWHPTAAGPGGSGSATIEPAIVYAAGQIVVPAEGEAVLDLVAAIVVANPEVFVTVTGHVDDLGDTSENAAVAFARATEVVGFLGARGVDPSRAVVVVAPPDPEAPPNESDEERRFNRRVEVRLENLLAPEPEG